MNIAERISEYFYVQRLGTSIQTEIVAGLSTYLSLAYIFFVNPAILSDAGMDKDAVFFATVAASAVSTLAMGAWARHPFALSAGLEMNAYVAYGVVQAGRATWPEALGLVFWAGVLATMFSYLKIRERLIAAIPDKMKLCLSCSVGAFLVMIGLRIAGLVEYQGVSLAHIGDFLSRKSAALFIGVAVIVGLRGLRVRTSILISIIAVSVFCKIVGIQDHGEAKGVSSGMFSGVAAADVFAVFRDPRLLSSLLILFLIDYFGAIAKFIGLTRNTPIVAPDGSLPRIGKAMMVDGWASVGGSLLGTTSIITFVESAVGIGVGGRTGLVAVVVGVLMLASIFLAPLIALVPVVATSGALVMVGVGLFPIAELRRDFSAAEAAVLIVMIGLVTVTFSLDKAMLLGFVWYGICDVAATRRVPDAYLTASVLLLAIGQLLA